uniref:Uncharacterized protein n=1 Tax=Chenopodium quinoa TaxID=63459 RepID=A0A803KQ97_CHEQI
MATLPPPPKLVVGTILDEKPVESKPIEVAEVETAAEAAPEKTEEAPPCELLSSFLSIFNMLQLEIAPADFHFPTTNQTRHCLTRYIIIGAPLPRVKMP